MKKWKITRAACLIVAVVVLTGALVAAGISGSPYEVLKAGSIKTAFLTNGVIEMAAEMYYNGELIESSTSKTAQNENSKINYYTDRDGSEDYFSYQNEDIYLNNSSVGPDGEDSQMWYNASRMGYRGRTTSLVGLDPEEQTGYTMQFVSLLADLLAGDLKNNITMSEENGVKKVYGSLTYSQIPELYTAALNMALSESRSGRQYIASNVGDVDESTMTRTVVTTYVEGKELVTETRIETVEYIPAGQYGNTEGYYEDVSSEYPAEATRRPVTKADFTNSDYYGGISNIPIESAKLSYAEGSAEIDENGYATSGEVFVRLDGTDIFGEKFNMEVKVSIKVSGINESDALCPVAGAEAFLKNWFESNDYNSVMFTLNSDGTINQDSLYYNTYTKDVFRNTLGVSGFEGTIVIEEPGVMEPEELE